MQKTKIIIGCDSDGLFTIRKLLALLLICVACSSGLEAQTSVTLNGNYYEVKRDSASLYKHATPTGMNFKAGETVYPIFKTDSSKYFVVRRSKKGNLYRQYLGGIEQ